MDNLDPGPNGGGCQGREERVTEGAQPHNVAQQAAERSAAARFSPRPFSPLPGETTAGKCPDRAPGLEAGGSDEEPASSRRVRGGVCGGVGLRKSIEQRVPRERGKRERARAAPLPNAHSLHPPRATRPARLTRRVSARLQDRPRSSTYHIHTVKRHAHARALSHGNRRRRSRVLLRLPSSSARHVRPRRRLRLTRCVAGVMKGSRPAVEFPRALSFLSAAARIAARRIQNALTRLSRLSLSPHTAPKRARPGLPKAEPMDTGMSV